MPYPISLAYLYNTTYNVPVDIITKLENNKGGITLDSFLKVVNGLSIDIKLIQDDEI